MLKKMAIGTAVALFAVVGTAQADKPEALSDLEIAHVAYTADLIDIRYAHLALAISTNADVRNFAEVMINDHTGVNDQALALLQRLDAAPVDNFLSRQLNDQADQLVREMSRLTGAAFDRRYAENELAYHQVVNGLVAGTFIPNIDNPEVKALFEDALVIFRHHEALAATTLVHTVPISDMREIAETLSVDHEGFELLQHTTAVEDLYVSRTRFPWTQNWLNRSVQGGPEHDR